MRFNRYNVRMRSWRPRFALLGLGALCVLGLGDSLGASGTFQGANGKLAYVSSPNIMLANADGTGAASVALGNHPSWNGEGTQIAFDSASIKILTVGGSTTDTGFVGSDPSFSPDGTKVAFVSGSPTQIFVAAVAGGPATNLSNSTSSDLGPSWSPDGTRIAFSRTVGATSSIWVMNADGTGQTQLTSTAVRATRSRSGRRTGARSRSSLTRVGRRRSTRCRPAAANATRLTNTASAATDPAYTPDGTKILFVQGGSVYTIPAAGGAASASPLVAGTAPDEQPTILAGTPFVSGDINAGSTLTASPGSWVGVNIVFSYQWQRCDATSFCINVGTNSATYTTVVADAGYTIQVVVTGANDASTATATSGPPPRSRKGRSRSTPCYRRSRCRRPSMRRSSASS